MPDATGIHHFQSICVQNMKMSMVMTKRARMKLQAMKKATVKMVGLILTVTLMKTTISYVVSIITELPCFNMDGFLFNSV